MKAAWLGLALALCAGAGTGQEVASVGSGAVLRGVDKISGQASDLDMTNGQVAEFGRLTVDLAQCRYPEGNPAGDAYAFMTIRDTASGRELFSGWMLASSPALNPLEHPRYDIWVLRCKI